MFDRLTDLVSGEWWSYLLIFAVSYLDVLIPLVPSETLVVTAGVLASSGDMSLPLVIVMGALGAFLGDNTAYFIGRRWGESVKRRFFSSKKAQERLGWADRQLAERGGGDHRHRAVPPRRPDGRVPRQAVCGCRGAALPCSTRSPASSGPPTLRSSATWAASSSRRRRGRASSLALTIAFSVAGAVELVRWLMRRRKAKARDAMNRLAGETSPYLLQHADNPVDWYPWGEEALARARAEDRPILLSIGYAACHWCHVMEHESFEDEDGARLQNDLFVNVKVDREERPGPRLGLHGRRRHADRARWLADDGLPHARRRAVLRRHVLPARAASRAAELPPGAEGGLERVPRAALGGDALGQPSSSRPSSERAAASVERAAHRVAGERGDAGLRASFDRGVGGVRARAEVPAALRARAPAPARRDGAGERTLDRDGGRRHVRPRRRRLSPLLRGRALARPALREDALRQRAARPAYLHGWLVTSRALSRGRRGDGRVHAARPAAARRAASPPRRTPTPTASRG